VRLRPAASRDDAFCFTLNEATMREYVEPVYGWDADIQQTYHARWFEPQRLSIIEDDDGREVGVLDVSDEGDHLYLARIEIMPDDQGRGLGTAVVTALLGRGRMVRLDVFPNDVRARRFYERLGFAVDREQRREGRLSMHHAGETFEGSKD
jgi:ribosomal protein S18 acetylase RimI-like enzyme